MALDSRSRVIRLSVPVTTEQHRRLSVVALMAQRTRAWLVRRAIVEYCERAAARWAKYDGISVAEWWAHELAAYEARLAESGNKRRLNVVCLDEDGRRISSWAGGNDGEVGEGER